MSCVVGQDPRQETQVIAGSIQEGVFLFASLINVISSDTPALEHLAGDHLLSVACQLLFEKLFLNRPMMKPILFLT